MLNKEVMTEEDPMMTVHQVAEALAFCDSTVAGLVRSGQIRAVKISRRWRIPRSEVARYLRDEGLIV